MANHQHALVRYVTLDRCLSRHRLTKEELIARCSAAVSDFTGDHRQLSERTFFNDLQALRDGIILGRCASIICTSGRYAYEVPGRSLFTAGDAEVEKMTHRLALMEERVQVALERLREHNAPSEVLAEMKALFLGDDLFGWVAARQRESEMAAEQARIEEERRLNEARWSGQAHIVMRSSKRGAGGAASTSDTEERASERPAHRREVMERKETPSSLEPTAPASEDGLAAASAPPPAESDAPKPAIQIKESKISSVGERERSEAIKEASERLRRLWSEVSELRADEEPSDGDSASPAVAPLTKEEAEEMAFAAFRAGATPPPAGQGLVARFFLRLRMARLLRAVERVVG